jgi:antitoxin ParD1/3/4
METINIAVPAALKNFLQRRVEEGGYGSVSEYVRELIRSDQRRTAQDVLEKELLRGLASGPANAMKKTDWQRIAHATSPHRDH